MEANVVKLYSLPYGRLRTWWIAALFVAGNIVLPQLCHLFPDGGARWLPIYFFTLVGTCKYGWRVGLLTALLSPTVNSALFGMPAVSMLPVVVGKSLLLVLFAAAAVARFHRVSIGILAGVVVSYQLLGVCVEWAVTGDLVVAFRNLWIALPGMALQLFGGWAVMRYLMRK